MPDSSIHRTKRVGRGKSPKPPERVSVVEIRRSAYDSDEQWHAAIEQAKEHLQAEPVYLGRIAKFYET